jgi:hypothetical protein
MKPTSSANSTAAIAAVPLSSTSVTPRQRPKACQLNPVSNNQFTIGLPPSPSPRNVLSSPIDAQNFKAPPQPIINQTPDNFNAQFEVDFTNIDQSQPQSAAAPLPQQLASSDESAKFSSLFKSTFPDPFEHDDTEVVQIQTSYADAQHALKQHGQQTFESMLESHQQSTAKVGGQHRRYMSDTSGFKV